MTDPVDAQITEAIARLATRSAALDEAGARPGCSCGFCTALRRDHDLVESLKRIAGLRTKRLGHSARRIAIATLDKYGITWSEET